MDYPDYVIFFFGFGVGLTIHYMIHYFNIALKLFGGSADTSNNHKVINWEN